jgi:hypothetical protein
MDRPPQPRTVKPRATGTTGVTDNPKLSLIVVDPTGVYVESTDTLHPRDELPAIIVSHPPALVVCEESGHVLNSLDRHYADHPDWQYKITPHDEEVWKPNRETKKPTVWRTVVVNWFGFRGAPKPGNAKGAHHKNRQKNHYHQMIDPHVFLFRFTLDDLVPLRPGFPDETSLMRLYRWGAALRNWAMREGVSPKPSAGGIAAQLLRDSRFYPEARRKVPRATNDKARDVLPGNYYDLRVSENELQFFTATYFDQVSAHHNVAATTPLPDANRLYAKGRFNKVEGKPWARRGTRLFDNAMRSHGLFYVSLKNPHFHPTAFILPCQRRKGWHDAFVWSNELSFLRETGTDILAIIAAWTSDYADTGIPEYAQWALTQLQDNAQHAPWLKPTLLATYGVLAARPRRHETAYKQSEKGEPARYAMGGKIIEAQRIRARYEMEGKISNVIQRGMIESETRLRSIRLAAFLHSFGLRVLAVYADSVFIENTGQGVPLLPGNWTIKGHLDRLQFFNSTSFTSDQLQKLPGIPKDDRDRLRRVQAARAFFGELKKIEKGERRARGRS